MFPGIDGFHWTAQHVIFLGLFFSVLVVVATTFSAALVRSYAAADDRQVDRIRWLTDFEDLPARDRRCRRQLTGELIHRTCPNAFRCAECDAFQASRRTTSSSDIGDTFGLDYRANRLYHR